MGNKERRPAIEGFHGDHQRLKNRLADLTVPNDAPMPSDFLGLIQDVQRVQAQFERRQRRDPKTKRNFR